MIEIASLSSDQTVIQGQNVRFECSASSCSNVIIEWTYSPTGSGDARVIADLSGPVSDEYEVYFGEHSSTLLIRTAVFERHSGVYTCMARDSHQSVSSSEYLDVWCRFSNVVVC